MSTNTNLTETKGDYESKMATQLERWRKELDKLDERSEDIKVEAKASMQELRAKGKEVEAKLDELKHAGENAWEQMRHGLDAAFYDLKAATERARHSLLDKTS